MISFYIERQSDDLLKASFFGEDNELLGETNDVTFEDIDDAVKDIFPLVKKIQIFDLPNA